MVAEKKKSVLRSTPGKKRQSELDKFAAAAGQRSMEKQEEYPWEASGVRKDVMKSLPLRLEEPLYLKLKYIASQTPYSMNSFILELLNEKIDEEIARLTGEN